MRNIAIIGSGQAGLLAAHALLRSGHRVTLYSDRTPAQWLHDSRPTGTAGRFELALAFERELGLDHWHAEAPPGEGAHVTFCPSPGNRLVTLTGRLRHPFRAIDLRLQSHRWLLELEARGGKVELEPVTVTRLEELAAGHELTVVAAGRAALAGLFPRDTARSVYTEPQRRLCMLCLKGPLMGFDGVPLLPVKFNLFAGIGEAFWVPYFHKDVGPSWNCLFEAIPGGPMDRFHLARSGEEALAIARRLVRELIPWDASWFEHAELSDRHGWLTGGFTPVVRGPVGRLPSGRPIMALGDTAMSVDPISAQGANSGNKMARNLAECVDAHGDRPFDEAWMGATFERFWARHGRHASALSNVFLEPMTPAGRDLLVAQYGSDGRADNASGAQRIANAFIENFNDPALLTHAFLDSRASHRFIEEATGGPWLRAVAQGGLRLARAQLRQRLGLEPGHPRVAA